MIDRIRLIFDKNINKDKKSRVWEWAISYVKDIEINQDTLENMLWNKLTYGYALTLSKNTIRNLAIAVGAIRIENPRYTEINQSFNNLNYPELKDESIFNEQALKMIEKAIGFKISLPSFIGNWTTCPTSYGMISDRHCYYLWILKRIIELCPDKNSSIIEIGAGMGILGYYLDKVGYKDYTTIDLAHANAIQTYFLYKNLPERDIILSGDKNNPFDLKYKNSLKLLHASDFKNIPQHRFDIMINNDGLTEMLIEDAEKYVNSDCTPMLLSINHEINEFRVIDIFKPTKILKYRYPFWLREGYVEELYVEN